MVNSRETLWNTRIIRENEGILEYAWHTYVFQGLRRLHSYFSYVTTYVRDGGTSRQPQGGGGAARGRRRRGRRGGRSGTRGERACVRESAARVQGAGVHVRDMGGAGRECH